MLIRQKTIHNSIITMANEVKIIYAAASLRTSSTKQETEGDSHKQQKEQILRRIEQESIRTGCRIVIKPEAWFKFSASASGEMITQPILEALEYCKNPKNKIKYFFIRSIDRGTRGGGGIYSQLKAEFAKYGVQLLDSYGIIGSTVINTLEDYGFKYRWSEFNPTNTNELIVAEGAKDEVRGILTRLIGAEIRYTKMGYTMGPAPIGYSMIKEDTENGQRKILYAHPEESQWIIRGYELRIQGNVSDVKIVSELNAMGYKSRKIRIYDPFDRKRIIGYKGQKPLTLKQFQKMIQSPIYAGIYVHRWTGGKPVKGRFKGLVTTEMFNKANRGKIAIIIENGEIMITKGKLLKWQAVKNKDNPLYPYRRFVLCPICKKPLLGSASRGKSGKHFPAYHCGRKINGERHNFRVKLDEFNVTIEQFVKKVRFSEDFRARFREIALEELEKREGQLSEDTVSYSKQVDTNEVEIQDIKETIKRVSSAEVIKMLEEDIEKLRLKNSVLKSNRYIKEDQRVDTQVTINYTNYFMEHLEDLLLGGSNPLQNSALFGLLFNQTPTYQELLDGTPKLACLFALNEDFIRTKSLDVSLQGLEP
jgi:site-specific DNA recombinase